MHRFEDLDAVQSSLQKLMQREPPLVVVLPRQPGTKNSVTRICFLARWKQGNCRCREWSRRQVLLLTTSASADWKRRSQP